MNVNQLQQNNSISQVNQEVSGKVLKNGAQVLVRVLGSKGNGKYEALVSGVKVLVTAKNPLKAGDIFVASANSKNGKIFISPNKETILQNLIEVFEGKNISDELADINAFVKNPQINSLLQSLGLVPDNLSLSILLQMKQLNQKLEGNLMNKIYNQAVKFKGKEKKAAEIMVLLNQKGINFTEEDIYAILIQMEERDGWNNDESDEFRNKDNFLSFENNFIGNFLNQIINQDNGKIGAFTIMNHLGWKKSGSGNGSWIILPFEIKEVEENVTMGKGNLKIYLNEMKKFKKIHLSCLYNQKSYNVLYEDLLNEINLKINADGLSKSESEICREIKKTIKCEKNINVEFVEKSLIENFAGGLEQVVMLGGTV